MLKTKHKKYNNKKKRTIKKYKVKHKMKGGSKGSDYRFRLVKSCKDNNLNEYDNITQEIMTDYRNGKKDFFIHLDRQINTFSLKTLKCLQRSLTQLQEDAIPESMVHLHKILSINY